MAGKKKKKIKDDLLKLSLEIQLPNHSISLNIEFVQSETLCMNEIASCCYRYNFRVT